MQKPDPRIHDIIFPTCSLLALKFRSISMAILESATEAYMRGVQLLESSSFSGAFGPSCC